MCPWERYHLGFTDSSLVNEVVQRGSVYSGIVGFTHKSLHRTSGGVFRAPSSLQCSLPKRIMPICSMSRLLSASTCTPSKTAHMTLLTSRGSVTVLSKLSHRFQGRWIF